MCCQGFSEKRLSYTADGYNLWKTIWPSLSRALKFFIPLDSVVPCLKIQPRGKKEKKEKSANFSLKHLEYFKTISNLCRLYHVNV